jgi:hypothetical protein
MGKRKGISLLTGPGGILAQPAHERGERRGDGTVGAGPHASEERDTALGGW